MTDLSGDPSLRPGTGAWPRAAMAAMAAEISGAWNSSGASWPRASAIAGRSGLRSFRDADHLRD